MTRTFPADKRKHVPQRSCVICKQVRAKRELTRLVSTASGIHIDLSGKANGRGAYLCGDPECWAKAARGEGLGKALKIELNDRDRALLTEHGVELAALTMKQHE